MYTPDWDSVSTHPTPEWFSDAKLGIFVHWGLYSVPAWAPHVADINAILSESGPVGMFRHNPYAEWYQNSAELRGTETWHHHRETYGEHTYADFRDEFDAQSAAANPQALAEIVARSGAGYMVLTTKHHDGFTLWPSTTEHPREKDWNAQRDIVGDVTIALRDQGIRAGFYYSGGYDWSYNGARMRRASDSLLATPTAPGHPGYAAYAESHLRELIDRYSPDILWNDIGWPGGGDLPAVLAHYYNSVTDGAINDRWTPVPARRSRLARMGIRLAGEIVNALWKLIPPKAKEVHFSPAQHSDFTTTEYVSFDDVRDEPWEMTRGIGKSFALNRNELDEDLIDPDELITTFVDVVSKNGNLLLGIGVDAAGCLPPGHQRVLDALGAWMQTNRAGVYGTRPWLRAAGRTADGTGIRYTRRGDTVNAILLNAPAGSAQVLDLTWDATTTARLLGGEELAVREVDGRLGVQLPEHLPTPVASVIVLVGATIRSV